MAYHITKVGGWKPLFQEAFICTKLFGSRVCGIKSLLHSTFQRREFNKTAVYASNKKGKQSEPKCYDVVIVGGGIIGVATGRELKKQAPNLNMMILEKESSLAVHQTGHNSGVIHAGIYYKPGSVRAKLCREGLLATYDYCDENDIPYKKVGKLIVATQTSQEKLLQDLYERALKNEVPDVKLIGGDEIKEFEPHCVGVAAIHSPHTGIIDWTYFTESLAKEFQSMGGKITRCFEVSKFHIAPESGSSGGDITKYPLTLTSKKGQSVRAGFVLTCSGLYSDKVAAMTGGSKDPAIIPFRGEYLVLTDEKSHIVKGNIYPVPDPRFPFLGVHFTPRMDGKVLLGPNAVLAFRREGYSYFNIHLRELFETILHPGFRKLAIKNFSYGAQEYIKSIFISKQVKELQQFIPTLTAKDIRRGPTGVRAQAISKSGELIEDFVFESPSGTIKNRVLHCRNAPSPGATSSLAIAKVLTGKVLEQMKKI